ncbi:MAG: peptidoglycan bridge formation glycyltransferase FemA/FemB family protein [Lachnospiraceae bacterium]|nr:peptidoglycan bridge formation glycyltransferase FemA/FemB family protein [Lachnospiraceae bacterium]
MAKQALQVITIDRSDEWDGIVKGFGNHDIYYRSGYSKAFRIHGDGEPLLFYYNDGIIMGINVAMKRSIKSDPHFNDILDEDRYFDLATPYGYGGWLIQSLAASLGTTSDRTDAYDKEWTDIEAASLSWLFRDYERWCLQNNIVSEFVRFHPMLANQRGLEKYYDVVKLGEVVHMDLKSPDDIWNNISSKNRNVIRKAIKNGVVIYNGRYPDIYKRFKAVYDSTMDKDKADEYYYFEEPFYDSICNDIETNAQVFWAEKDGNMIAASIILDCNGFMNYHLSGSVSDYGHLAPTNLILYKVALWGCEHGMRTLYLGGGVGSGEDSLYKFKRAFYKGKLNHFYIGRKVFDREAYRELTIMRGDGIKNERFFPVYRG